MPKKATPYTETFGFSDRLVRTLTGCGIDQIPKGTLSQGTVLKSLLRSYTDAHLCILCIADGSYLEPSSEPTGDPCDYEVIVIPQKEELTNG
jgi:hypothetical protein